MNVVSNSSPLIGLSKVGRLDLLKFLYGTILIPPLVYDDVVIRGEGRPGSCAVKNAVDIGWIQVIPITDGDNVPPRFAEMGEGEAIALAIEQNAEFLIVDDRAVRNYCNRIGFDWLSTGGVIRDACQAGYVRKAKLIFDQMFSEGFGIWDYNDILRALGEIT